MSRALPGSEPTRRERGGFGLQALAFAVTGGLIYFCGMKYGQLEQAPTPPPPACAVAVLRMARPSDADAAQQQAALQQLLFSDATLASVVAELPPGSLDDAERAALRQSLSFTLAPGAAADECRATISYGAPATAASTAIVNSLARRSADAWQGRRRSLSQNRYAAAKEAASRGRQSLAEARAKLANFLDRHFQELEAQLREPATATNFQADSRPASADGPRLIDNPQWQALWQEVMALRHTLLTKRGPAANSPEAQHLHLRIEELEKQLGKLPRKLPASPPAAVEPQQPAVQPLPPVEPQQPAVQPPPDQSPKAVRQEPRKSTDEQLQLVSAYHSLCAAVERAVADEARLAQTEREAWQDHQQEPVVALLLAGAPAARTAAAPVGRLFWIAVAAATAMACGVGMVSSGKRSEPALTTLQQVRRATTLPVFSVIREADLPNEPENGSARSGAPWRLTAGLALILCTVISVAMVMGRG